MAAHELIMVFSYVRALGCGINYGFCYELRRVPASKELIMGRFSLLHLGVCPLYLLMASTTIAVMLTDGASFDIAKRNTRNHNEIWLRFEICPPAKVSKGTPKVGEASTKATNNYLIFSYVRRRAPGVI